ncbi:MAG: hypothetical protein FWG40_00040 [Peptococcaceae bacterium]|nr:hypothetical protein [Peptococcaceae bacterium]
MTYFEHHALMRRLLSTFIIVVCMGVFLGAYLFLIRLLGGGGLDAFCPVESDEADYFRTLTNLIQYGPVNNGGYNGYFLNGEVFIAKFLNYSGHGFLILWPYFLMFLFLGKGFSTVILSNLLLLACGFLTVYFVTNSLRKTVVVLSASLTFLPMLLFFGSFMMEVSQYFFVIVAAALLWRYQKDPSRVVGIAFVILVLAFCVIRITNVLFLIPYIVLKSHRTKRPLVCGLIMSFALLALCYGINIATSLFMAPFPTGILYGLSAVLSEQSVLGGISFLIDHSLFNFKKLLFPFDSVHIWVIMRYVMIFLFFLFLTRGFVYYDYSQQRLFMRKAKDPVSLSFAMVAFSILGLNVVLYDLFAWRDFRVFAPFVLFFVIYIFISSRMKSIMPLISTVVLLVLLTQYNCLDNPSTQARWTNVAYPHFANELLYDDNPESPWDNTILTSLSRGTDTRLMLEKDSRFGWIVALSLIDDTEGLPFGYMLLYGNSPEAYPGYELVTYEDDQYLYKRISLIKRVSLNQTGIP